MCRASSYYPLLDSNRFSLVVLPLDNKNLLPGDGHGVNVVFKHHCEENHTIGYLLYGRKQSTSKSRPDDISNTKFKKKECVTIITNVFYLLKQHFGTLY